MVSEQFQGSNREGKQILNPIELVTRLRVATVADTADSLYQLMTDAAYEIELLRKLAEALCEETKKCGAKHDSVATMRWQEYEIELQEVRGE